MESSVRVFNKDINNAFEKNKFIIAQVFMSTAQTFQKVYWCAYKVVRDDLTHQPKQITYKNYKLNTTPPINAFFASLFEDSSFVNSAFDHGIELYSYKRLRIDTGKGIDSVARAKAPNPNTLPIQSRLARDSSIVLYRSNPQKYFTRWGNVYDSIYGGDHQNEKDYLAHTVLLNQWKDDLKKSRQAQRQISQQFDDIGRGPSS